MPINAHPDFLAAEKEYLAAETKEQKIRTLKKMISHAPGHKGAERLRAQLKRRLAKLKYANEKEIKQKRGGKEGIRKSDMQTIILGETNTGKSLLLSILTNATPKISSNNLERFTTKKPMIGMMDYQGVQIQIIENPAIESEYYDRGLTHTADTLLILVTNLEQIKEIENSINTSAKKIIVFNIKNQQDKRKLEATLKSRKYNFVIANLNSIIQGGGGVGGGMNELKEKLFQSFNKIRVYTKEPGKAVNKEKPIVLPAESTVEDAAEKILHGFSKNIKEARVTGPSSKFTNQKTSLSHKLKDLDVVEFKTK